ncbi:scyllo-inositol 2-dehydrogenase (NAD(+)) [Halomicronema hongdechloris C2206]|uniref:Scyllo-inositol 2-dehydrogenase (NAD(+)) n=1 Tax=Halomicronema hongdechloris C2206 TaxID=1641165 RepID=A0A1Z3HKJ1_9CYAN|nr:Gfo/Idh/MocA family oxidoreductase [Halomicronema hongdechloris]ASC70829.1 scyllo-inositol 2-dehydrogenase (NAD(+)) [Halomicronema hongdechloris C2206]
MNQVVVVGAGNWGKNLVRNFHELNALAGVVEVNPSLRHALSVNYPETIIYSDYQEALIADAMAIVLATPASTHYSLALAALEAGKDVFIEKPMTLRTEEARDLTTYADEHDRILMVGHLLLYQPAIAWMRDYLAAGKAGAVRHIATQRLKLGRVRAEENVWWSFAPHDISVVLELLGRPALESVQAQGQAIIQLGIEDYVHVDLTFAGGQSAHIHCSWYWPLVERRTTVLCEHQILVYDEVAQTVTIHHKRVDGETRQHFDEGTDSIAIAADQPLRLECQHFLNCLETRQRPHSDGWNGVAVVEILERAHIQLDAVGNKEDGFKD